MTKSRMKIDKKRLLEDATEEKWDADTVSLVLHSKMINRSKKHKSVHPVYVLVSPNKEVYRDKGDEFDAFLTNMKEKVDNSESVPSRFQVALQYKTNDYLNHWITLDAKYVNGKLEVFILDSIAGNNSDVLAWVEQTRDKILNVFPDANIYSYNGPRLQADGVSCSRFTINSILAMQECDVVSTLESSNPQGGISKVNPEALPREMTKIFRPTQSYKALATLPPEMKESVASKRDNLTLQDVVEQHKSKDQRPTNEYVTYKKQRYLKSMQSLIKKMKIHDIADAIDNRAKGLPIVIVSNGSVIKKSLKEHMMDIFKKKNTRVTPVIDDQAHKMKK